MNNERSEEKMNKREGTELDESRNAEQKAESIEGSKRASDNMLMDKQEQAKIKHKNEEERKKEVSEMWLKEWGVDTGGLNELEIKEKFKEMNAKLEDMEEEFRRLKHKTGEPRELVDINDPSANSRGRFGALEEAIAELQQKETNTDQGEQKNRTLTDKIKGFFRGGK